ncbi:MAG TPA: AI-2E family transporter YdiK [Acetobacteraceae bacterium]|nr:AI-2E family transporter YdiK [Acetobacteraceae bacterium]
MERPIQPVWNDVTRASLAVMFIAGLALASFWVMRPFVAAIVWAVTLVVATWPIMLQVERRLGGRRWLAVTVMTVGLVMIVIVPFWLAVNVIIAKAGLMVEFVQSLDTFRVPGAPGWLAGVPLFGDGAAAAWNSVSNLGLRDLAPDLTPYLGQAARFLVSLLGGVGIAFVQFLMTVVIAAIMYAHGEAGAALVRQFGRRLGGPRGEEAVLLVARAIHGVALGVVAASLLQAVIGGVAFAIVQMPFTAVLTALLFFACVIQIGPGIVLIPAVIWMFWSGRTVHGTVLLVATVIVLVTDNVVRPLLMKRSAQLPLVLILAGVLGGLSAFGLVGIFVGPTVLAVSYTLLRAWMADAPAALPGAEVRAEVAAPPAAAR